MVVTRHWIDSSWKLQKRVLSFINIPPPRGGLQISDAIFKFMKEWGIERKVFTITVDNATSNDSAIRYMKDTVQRSRSLVCGGRLFHVRCCAHILNLCVQDGLEEIRHGISDVRDSVEYVNQSEARCCGYPTSNLFLQEVQKIKSALDSHINDEDSFIVDLVGRMKKKFDKYRTRENISKVKEIINTLYEEYVVESMNKGNTEILGSSNTFGSQTTHPSSIYHWDDFDAYCEEVETSEPTRSELVDSLEKGRLKKNEIPSDFSCLD
nr:zinc finger BED domain-containing protein RICESLEEPER 2-like [Ipomoea batatas]